MWYVASEGSGCFQTMEVYSKESRTEKEHSCTLHWKLTNQPLKSLRRDVLQKRVKSKAGIQSSSSVTSDQLVSRDTFRYHELQSA